MTSNIYDFDGTIYDGDSTLDFLLYRIKKNPKMFFGFPILLISFFMFFFKLSSKDEFKSKLFSYITKTKNLETDLKSFWDENFIKIKDFYKSSKQSSDIIISASPYFLLQPLENYLSIKQIIATKFDLNTNRLVGPNCYGIEKVKALNTLFPNIKIAKFYSDSIADEPLASLAQKAYYVKGQEVLEWTSVKVDNNKFSKQLKSLEFLRFIFSGGIGTLLNFGSSVVISNWIDPVITYLISYSVSLIVTYILSSKLVFSEKISMKRLLKFIIAYVPNFIILFSFVAVFINLLGVNRIIVYAMAGLLGLPLTFILVKMFTFNKKEI